MPPETFEKDSLRGMGLRRGSCLSRGIQQLFWQECRHGRLGTKRHLAIEQTPSAQSDSDPPHYDERFS